VLSGLFFMLTLWAYARYARRRSKVEGRGSKVEGRGPALRFRLSTLDYALSLFCFALGLLSKTMLVTVPFVLLPLHRLELSSLNSQRSTLKRLLLGKIPFLLLSAVACAATLQAQESSIPSVQSLSVWSRFGNALVSYVVYLRQMFYPSGLAACRT